MKETLRDFNPEIEFQMRKGESAVVYLFLENVEECQEKHWETKSAIPDEVIVLQKRINEF